MAQFDLHWWLLLHSCQQNVRELLVWELGARVTNEIHEYMLKKATLAPELSPMTDNQDASQPVTTEVEDQANAITMTSIEYLQGEEMIGDLHESHLNLDITSPIARTGAELRPHTEPIVR
ncbi:hypothetical protein SUGI_0966250 [Cryptomeria japonica]|nr:hypothetical protein SUGI_0966250 [Cryptomeria japonica]